MNILVNYKVKNNKVTIDDYMVNGRNVLIFESVYDLTRIAIVSTDLDNNDDLRLVKFPEFPFPTIVTKETEEELLKQSKLKNNLESETEIKEPINRKAKIGDVDIEYGERID